VATPVARFTDAADTPATALRALDTVLTQPAQVIPSTGRWSTVPAWVGTTSGHGH